LTTDNSLLDPSNTTGPPPLENSTGTNSTTTTSTPNPKSHVSSGSKVGLSIGVPLGIGALAGGLYVLLWWIRRRKTAASRSILEAHKQNLNLRRSSVQELDGRNWQNYNFVQCDRTASNQSSQGGFEKWAVELDGTGIR
jgi:hypothetical protein